ncbi:helix-turn-helix domain-containing protein [Curvibacter sp. CHRR-16]|uniref:AraC family transcriptional regulator n=1 Tax=Curvibacter sp. CHRR-16 TaxID=2835872 RepID=UPI001BDAEA50|nr:AraC family transcriptional regulator [Curvibacter sp. CHRR-16]MBT0571502.1 helix-turn-helix domain-containing protein [Curvibacter sp. CHRR-16]
MTELDSMSVRHYSAARGSHSHGHFQILWALDGVLELEVEGRGLCLSAGAGYVIHPGERHDFESRRGSRCWVLDTHEAHWAACLRSPTVRQPAYQLVKALVGAMEAGLPVSTTHGAYLLSQLWMPSSRGAGGAGARLGQPEPVSRQARSIDWVALQAWVGMRLSLPLTCADLAQRVNLSESQLRARCQQELGCSPMQWVRQLRLQQGQVLRQQGLSAHEAALRVGYQSAAVLAAARRRH